MYTAALKNNIGHVETESSDACQPEKQRTYLNLRGCKWWYMVQLVQFCDVEVILVKMH